MKRPVELILAILCVVSIYRPFSGDTTALELVGYIAMALLSALLILALHLKPNDDPDWVHPSENGLPAQHASGKLWSKTKHPLA